MTKMKSIARQQIENHSHSNVTLKFVLSPGYQDRDWLAGEYAEYNGVFVRVVIWCKGNTPVIVFTI